VKDERLCCARRNYCHQHLLQNKNERKIKCSDKKKAIGNELLGNALFPGLMPFVITEGQGSSIKMK